MTEEQQDKDAGDVTEAQAGGASPSDTEPQNPRKILDALENESTPEPAGDESAGDAVRESDGQDPVADDRGVPPWESPDAQPVTETADKDPDLAADPVAEGSQETALSDGDDPDALVSDAMRELDALLERLRAEGIGVDPDSADKASRQESVPLPQTDQIPGEGEPPENSLPADQEKQE